MIDEWKNKGQDLVLGVIIAPYYNMVINECISFVIDRALGNEKFHWGGGLCDHGVNGVTKRTNIM